MTSWVSWNCNSLHPHSSILNDILWHNMDGMWNYSVAIFLPNHWLFLYTSPPTSLYNTTYNIRLLGNFQMWIRFEYHYNCLLSASLKYVTVVECYTSCELLPFAWFFFWSMMISTFSFSIIPPTTISFLPGTTVTRHGIEGCASDWWPPTSWSLCCMSRYCYFHFHLTHNHQLLAAVHLL